MRIFCVPPVCDPSVAVSRHMHRCCRDGALCKKGCASLPELLDEYRMSAGESPMHVGATIGAIVRIVSEWTPGPEDAELVSRLHRTFGPLADSESCLRVAARQILDELEVLRAAA